MSKIDKIIIVGAAGSGKDYLLRRLVYMGLKPGLKHTTRPMRIGEQQNIDYIFTDSYIFDDIYSNTLFLSKESFNIGNEIWNYGLTYDEFYQKDVFIMTPSEVNQLPNDIKEKAFVLYLNIDRSVREQRLVNRNDKDDSYIRRLESDDKDFNVEFKCDMVLTDPDFDPCKVYEAIIEKRSR